MSFESGFNQGQRLFQGAQQLRQRREEIAQANAMRKQQIEQQAITEDLRRQKLEQDLQYGIEQQAARKTAGMVEADIQMELERLRTIPDEGFTPEHAAYEQQLGIDLNRLRNPAPRMADVSRSEIDPMTGAETKYSYQQPLNEIEQQTQQVQQEADPLIIEIEERIRANRAKLHEAEDAQGQPMTRLNDFAVKYNPPQALGRLMGIGETNEDKQRRLRSQIDRDTSRLNESGGMKPGTVIEQNGQRMRYIGGDPNDPNSYEDA